MSQQTFHISGPATIHIHDGQTTATTAGMIGTERASGGAERAEVLFEKKQAFDPDYDNRPGYDESFLGVKVPLPSVHAERRGELLTTFGKKVLLLHYHHYSLVMNKARRFVVWAASNVDYSPDMRGEEGRDAFGGENWRLDPRVPARFQVQDDEFYKPAKKIDRGHVVRRDDAVWGATFEERARANADTYHWTNCTPQHERFNQSKRFHGAWGALEDQIKSEAQRTGTKLSVFAGPVLAADDPDALDIQYPLKFWKVIASVEDGALSAYGFVLDQGPVIDKHGLGLEEKLDFVEFSEQQCSLHSIEALTGVAFDHVLHEADVMGGEEAVEIKTAADTRRRRRER